MLEACHVVGNPYDGFNMIRPKKILGSTIDAPNQAT